MSIFQVQKITYDELSIKLHELIENDYAIESIYSADAQASWFTEVEKLISIWANISPGDLLSNTAVQEITGRYINDRSFTERWSAIGFRMQTWLHATTDITIHDLTKFVVSQMVISERSPVKELIPSAMLMGRAEATHVLERVEDFSAPEMFWFTCIILARLTMERSKLFAAYQKMATESNTVKKTVRRPTRIQPTATAE